MATNEEKSQMLEIKYGLDKEEIDIYFTFEYELKEPVSHLSDPPDYNFFMKGDIDTPAKEEASQGTQDRSELIPDSTVSEADLLPFKSKRVVAKIGAKLEVLARCCEHQGTLDVKEYEANPINRRPKVLELSRLAKIDKDAMVVFFRYLHFKESYVTVDNVMNLMHIAKKFRALDALHTFSAYLDSFDVGIDTVDAAYWFLKYSQLPTGFTEKLKNFIDTHASEFLNHRKFESLEAKQIVRIISRDTFYVTKERLIVEALYEWAKAEAKRRGYDHIESADVSRMFMAPFINHIRWRRITDSQRLSLKKNGISVSELFYGKESFIRTMRTRIPHTPRVRTCYAYENSKRIEIRDSVYYSEFQCDQPIIICKLGVFGPAEEEDFQVSLSVRVETKLVQVLDVDPSFEGDNETRIFYHVLETPLQVPARTKVTVKVTPEFVDDIRAMFGGVNMKKKVLAGTTTFTFSTPDDNYKSLAAICFDVTEDGEKRKKRKASQIV